MDKRIDAKLKALKADYLKSLPDKIAALEAQWRDISLDCNKQHLINLHRTVHSLRGSSGTYGYSELFEALRDLEIYLKQLIDYRSINATHKSDISHLVERIKDAFSTNDDNFLGAIISYNKIISSKLIIYLIHRTSEFKRALQHHVNQQGFQFLFLKTIAEFQALIKKQLPCTIIIDEYFLDDKEIKVITNFRKRYEIPLWCIAYHGDVFTRLKAIRVGVSSFIEQSMDASQIAMRLVKRCELLSKEDYRILILEDSETLADYYSLLLEEAGMRTLTLSNPMQLMQALQEFNPNILLMDLYLPGCTGFELAMLVRQEERYMSIPIIFISTEDDRYKQLAILNGCGGDDFLTKPVLPQNLIAAVKSRAERSALLSSYIIRDSLTKLLNHSYILKQLEIEILRAQRKNEVVCVAMIDLDHFKKINDKHGHPMGDLVLRKIAELLTKKIRQTDFIGRYGGEEIIIIFPDTFMDNAVPICNKICEDVSHHLFTKGRDEFHVTLSIGVANYPDLQTASSLIAAADRALYEAKSKGRNRVQPAY